MIYIRETDLQSMCLNVVVQHIQYISKPNKSTEVYVEFLRRCYSDRLYSILERKGLHTEQYIEWFLTPYWRNVSLPIYVDYPVNNIINKLQVMGHAIVSLNLYSSSCSVDILSAIICCVPNVTYLNLRDTYCTDNLLSLIRKMCISLNILNLSRCESITDTGMAYLCNLNKKDSGFDSLKILNILETPVTPKGVALILKHLPSIQCLSYEGLSTILYSIHKSDVHNNPVRYNLRNFEYCQMSTPLKQVLEIWTVMCPFVTRVCILSKIDENDLRLCTNFQCLKMFKIGYTNYFPREALISPFITLKGPMLTELEVMLATVSVELIVKLCCNLKKIFFFNVTFEDFNSPELNDGLNVLTNLTSLTIKHLNFQKDFAFKSIIFLIKAGKNLNELYIHFVQHFSDRLADTILELPKLTLVNFIFVDIEIQTLRRFFAHENITKIRIDGGALESDNANITGLINDNPYANTCAWTIDYNEVENGFVLDCPEWSREISS